MKVVITGANSAVGQAILRCNRQQGDASNAFIAVVRSSRAGEQLRSQGVAADRIAQISYDDSNSLDAAFEGASAVIHLAGVLVETRNSTYEQANVESTRSVVDAAKRRGCEKFVLVSATGADEASANRYYRTKGQAEALVRASGLRYTILRAPLILGPGTAGAAALQQNVRGPRAKLIGGGRNRQQPLYVDDLARAAIAATSLSVARDLTLDIVGPMSLPERELVERAARLLGRKIQIASIPKGLLSLVLTARQRFGSRGFSRDALEVVTAETCLDPKLAAHQLGIELTGIDEMIRRSVSGGLANE
jgi:nucleoside-diphosphate-sugar epimerase